MDGGEKMYARANIQNTYQQNSAMTASPLDLVIMLYDGLIKNLKLADIYASEKNYEKVNSCCIKAEAILGELMSDLDMKYSMSKGLFDLYEFMLNTTINANATKEMTELRAIAGMLEELRDTWKSIRGSTGTTYSQE